MRRTGPILLALLTIGPTASGDSIVLRRSVEAGEGPVTLSRIADLEGPKAEALADVIIADDAALLPIAGAHARRVDVALVRERLEGQPGVNWAFVTLRGTATRLVEPARTAIEAESPAPPTSAAPAERPEQAVIPGTIRALAQDVLLKILRVEAEDLRVRWPDRYDDFLNEPVNGRLIHVQPIGQSARIPLSITVYDGDRIVREETVRAEIRVRRRAHVASRPLARGTRLVPDDYSTRVLWLDPGELPAASVDDQVTTRMVEPGSAIEESDIAPPFVVERGEVVMLRCIAGAVMLQSTARALEAGRDGDVIRFELTSNGERVMARMNGRGKAVLVVPSAAEARGDTRNEVG
ncbi:MAG: flagellar basal body P-ring formation protein FlgA [Phycisphaeraceae bacterium]|nr:MAG: flagellar basal body P-ring formation protein FlgA [Phycisphaeraceae bacterium]